MGLVSAITEYLFVSDPPEQADVILIPGSPYTAPAEMAARFFHGGCARLLVPSGSCWLLHRRSARANECTALAYALTQAGVPETAILREARARHTLDNARLSRALLDDAGVTVRTAILCCQSFHARRCLKAYRKYFPDARLLACPSQTRGIDAANWHRSFIGIFKVAAELLKCTGLFFFLISFIKAK